MWFQMRTHKGLHLIPQSNVSFFIICKFPWQIHSIINISFCQKYDWIILLKKSYVWLYYKFTYCIINLGIFNKLGDASFLIERRWWNVKKRFFNLVFGYHYPFINSITICNSKIKNHLTQQWFRWNPIIWQHSTCVIECSYFYFMQVSLTNT